MPNQTPVGIVVNDMLDEDRERLVECRGRRSGEEWRGSGEGSRGGVSRENRAQEALAESVNGGSWEATKPRRQGGVAVVR